MNYIVGAVKVLTSGSSDVLSITVNRDMTVAALAFDATGIFKITGCDIQGQDDILGATATYPVLGRALSDGGRPLMLPESMSLPKGSSITISITDLSAAGNTVGVALIGTA